MIIKEHFDLSPHNGYRVSATCRRAYFPECVDDLISFFRSRDRSSFIIIGSGHNIILSKSHYEQDILLLSKNFAKTKWHQKGGDYSCYAEGGALLESLSIEALSQGATGLEDFYDIPSSLAGAVVMNAGTKDSTIGGLLEWVGVFDVNLNEYVQMHADDLDFRYRYSPFQGQESLLVIDAQLALRRGDSRAIKAQMKAQKSLRWSKQPGNYPNCGSVFKRPEGKFVGPMIESLGFKGFQIGGAQVSEKHAGFIVNAGDATGADILNLVETIQQRVHQEFGVSLELEQQVI